MVDTQKPATNPLEQFLAQSKLATTNEDLVIVIQKILETPGVYVFSELLETQNIQELAAGPYAQWFNLLNIFAYGTYSDYKANKATLPDLTSLQITKLRHLTIVSLAAKSRCIPYSTLLKELDMKNLRELEDLFIEVVYAGILHGKLDQKNGYLEVDYAIGRDIKPETIDYIIDTLQDWCDGCETMLSNIETQIIHANSEREKHTKTKAQIEEEVARTKKALQDSQQQHIDSRQGTSHHSQDSLSGQEKSSKKQPKTKGLRGSSSKFSWAKS